VEDDRSWLGAEVPAGGPSRDMAASMASVHGTPLPRSLGEVAPQMLSVLGQVCAGGWKG